MTRQIAEDLVSSGRSYVKDLSSRKSGKLFNAELVMTVEDGKARLKLEFPGGKKGGDADDKPDSR